MKSHEKSDSKRWVIQRCVRCGHWWDPHGIWTTDCPAPTEAAQSLMADLRVLGIRSSAKQNVVFAWRTRRVNPWNRREFDARHQTAEEIEKELRTHPTRQSLYRG
jgi:hypothetical protein